MPIPTLPGGHFRKIDLHIHTPASYDFRDKHATAEDIVKAAIASELDAIAITDHNHYAFVDAVMSAAKGTNLVVFPGVEISTNDGHMLAILDVSRCGNDISNLLGRCGIGSESEFGRRDAQSSQTMIQVADVVSDYGGVAIAAHVDGDKGFLHDLSNGLTKQNTFCSLNIHGLEVLDSNLKAEYENGRLYTTSKACLQFSDAHSLSQIGTKSSWVKLAQVNVSGLKMALKDPMIRIRLPGEPIESVSRTWIEKLEISRGFFQGTTIDFNPGLNCIVGGQGVGKSALLEFLRFALDNQSTVRAIQDDCAGKLAKLLGYGGEVTVVIHHEDGEKYRISRTYDGEENPIHVERILLNGSTEEFGFQGINNFFSILAYSQGEGMSIARDAIKQLELIDRHLDLTGLRREIAELRQKLRKNSQSLTALDASLANLAIHEMEQRNLSVEIQQIEVSLQRIQEAQQQPILLEHPKWQDELNYLKATRAGIENLRDGLVKNLEAQLFHEIERELPVTGLGNESELEGVQSLANEAREIIDELKNLASERLSDLVERIRQRPSRWTESYNTHDKAYKEFMRQQPSVEAGELQSKLEKKKQRLINVDSHIRRAKSEQKDKATLHHEREKLLNTIETQYAMIFARRKKQAQSMTEILERRVIVSVVQGKSREQYQNWLNEKIRGNKIPRTAVEALTKSEFTPRQFAKHIRLEEWDHIARATQLSETIVKNIIDKFGEDLSLLYELEEVEVEDTTVISLRRNDGEYRQLHELSTGQKFTVIILLALTDDTRPVIYDQPEDALDTSMIYSDIAQILRKSKDKRQFIFATHNSNMSVSADMDLAIVLEGNATNAQVSQVGGIEDKDVSSLLIKYLEGGKEAIRQRINKFYDVLD